MTKKIISALLAVTMLFMTACGDSSTAEDSKTVESAAESASDSSERESDSKPSGDWNAELITTGTETKKTDSTTAKGSDSQAGATTTTKSESNDSKQEQPQGQQKPQAAQTSQGNQGAKVNQAPRAAATTRAAQTPKPAAASKANQTPKPSSSHTHNWKPVYYTKYACYQATTDGNSFVSKTYYFRNENGDCASKQDLANMIKACEECEDYIFSPQNKSACTYAEISKPFGPSNEVAFYYCVNGSNIEATFNPNGGEVFNFYTSFSGTLVNSVKNGGVWVKGTIFEKM